MKEPRNRIPRLVWRPETWAEAATRNNDPSIVGSIRLEPAEVTLVDWLGFGDMLDPVSHALCVVFEADRTEALAGALLQTEHDREACDDDRAVAGSVREAVNGFYAVASVACDDLVLF